MTEYLKIEVSRDAYSQEDIDTMTVGELIRELRNYDEDLPVILSHDNGYTYGGLYIYNFETDYYDDEEDEEEDDWYDDEDEEDDEEGDV